jgi:hypothetical protein
MRGNRFSQGAGDLTHRLKGAEMVWPNKSITVAVRTDGDAKPINAWTLFGTVVGMALWAVLCSAAWYASARGDYANLAIAKSCYSENGPVRARESRCDGIKPPDAYMSEVDRKARISRLATAAGAGLGCVALIASRRRRKS